MTQRPRSPATTRLMRYFKVLVPGLLLVLAGGWSAFHMEEQGHVITGMNNQVVWGLPHVFALFLIVSASGVLNVASMGSVFGQTVYKARAPLSGLLAIAMLAAGLSVLMLDLGRPDRVVLAATTYNVTSVFAWNVLLYSGLFATVLLYLWTLLDRTMGRWSKPAGTLVFAWRFILTSGTGLIFAFLVARQAYGSALLPPMFVIMSFAWGMGVFLLAQGGIFRWHRLSLEAALLMRMKNLLALFVLAVLYLVVIYHMTNLYFSRQAAFERFILLSGGAPTLSFWFGYVLVGTLFPLLLLLTPLGTRVCNVLLASFFVLIGAFSFLYTFIVGGQEFPLLVFAGYKVHSSFGDGMIASYTPSLYEWLLGLGGLGVAFVITVIGLGLFDFLPKDATVKAPA